MGGYIQINRNKSRRPSCTTKATGTSGPENRSTPFLLLNQTVFFFIRPDISVGILIGPENVGRYFEKACRYFDRA